MSSLTVQIVLVRPLYETNVGATARAMQNFAADQLVLIGPRSAVGTEASNAAAHAQSLLKDRIELPTWESFESWDSSDLRIGFSARQGRGRPAQEMSLLYRELLKSHPLLQQDERQVRVSLIFGPEEHGLSADDLEHVHRVAKIPTSTDNPSLNLAQAVLLALFSLRQEFGWERKEVSSVTPTDRVPFPEDLLRQWLEALGFEDDRRVSAFNVMKRLLLQNAPTADESRVLEAVLRKSIRH